MANRVLPIGNGRSVLLPKLLPAWSGRCRRRATLGSPRDSSQAAERPRSAFGTTSLGQKTPRWVALHCTAPGPSRPLSGRRERRKACVGKPKLPCLEDHSGTDHGHSVPIGRGLPSTARCRWDSAEARLLRPGGYHNGGRERTARRSRSAKLLAASPRAVGRSGRKERPSAAQPARS